MNPETINTTVPLIIPMKPKNLFFSLTMIILLIACTKEPAPTMKIEQEIDQSLINFYKNFNATDFEAEIDAMWNSGPCKAITINKNTKLYNITGWVLSDTKPNAKVYLSPAKNTSFDHAREVIRSCHPIWESKVMDEKFAFNHVPEGAYVVYTPVSSYTEAWGPPLPHTFNLNYEINISFHGGDLQYMISAFELKSKI